MSSSTLEAAAAAAAASSASSSNEETTTTAAAAVAAEAQQQQHSFVVGQLVSVASRTWPGINQPGGVGRITGVSAAAATAANQHSSSSSSSSSSSLSSAGNTNHTIKKKVVVVSVKYVIDGRHEKEIAVQYVQPHSLTTTANPLRDRTMLLGRCLRCGSLRADCGSCDHFWMRNYAAAAAAAAAVSSSFVEPQRQRQRRRNQSTTTTKRGRLLPNQKSSRPAPDDDDDSEMESDDDDDSDSIDLEVLLEKHRLDFQKYKRLQAKAKKLFRSDNAELGSFSPEVSSSSSSSSDDEPTTAKAVAKAPANKIRVKSSSTSSTSKTKAFSNAAKEAFSSSSSDRSSSSSENDGPLHQLMAFQSSQQQQQQNTMLAPRIDRRQPAWSSLAARHQQQRAQRRLMIRRARSSILKSSSSSSSSSSSEDDGVFATSEETKIRKDSSTLNHCRPRPRTPPSLSVSNPASPDVVGGTLAATAAAAAAAESPGFSQHAPDRVVTTAYHDDDHNDDDDDHADDQDDDAMDVSVVVGDPTKAEAIEGGFIQPEGNANILPSDVHDATAGLDYPELAPFFDKTVLRLERDDIPAGKQQVLHLEREWRDYHHEHGDRQALGVILKRKSKTLHDELIQTLVREGLDQSQSALRKLSSKRLHKRYKKRFADSAERLVAFVDHDAREFKLDALSQAVEDILAKLRNFSASILSDDSAADDDASPDAGYDSDGWADPDSQSPLRQLGDEPSQFDIALKDNERKGDEHFDPHPYASKKRKARTTVSNKRTNARQKKRRDRASDRVPSRETVSGGAKDSIFLIASGRRKMRQEKQTLNEAIVADNFRHESTSDAEANHDAMDSSSSISICDDPNQVTCTGAGPSRSKTLRMMRHSANDVSGKAFHKTTTRIKHSKTDRGGKSRKSQQRSEASGTNADDDAALWPESDRDGNDGVGSWRNADVPELENILPGVLGSGVPPRGDLVAGHQRKREAVADRMVRWLDSNAINVVGDAEEGTEERLALNIRKVRGSSKMPSEKTLQITRERLFSSLYKRSSTSTERMSTIPLTGSDMQDLCRALAETDSNVTCKKILNDICDTFTINNIIRENADAALAFKTMIDILKAGGSRTLQDLVSSDSPALERFVDVLVATLRLLRLDMNKSLSPMDGTIFLLFRQDRSAAYVDFVVQQMVESVMSLFQPKAWDLRVKDRRKVLSALEPLRNELALHTALTERVCNCLARELGQQEWRCVRGGDSIFVSSIDPDLWCAFLSSASLPPKATRIRHASFERHVPRCEIEAIWCLVAYFAGTEAPIDIPDCYRWQFLSQVLTKGSLSASATSDSLPPAKEQIDAAVADLANLTDLVASGSLGCLPRRDNVLLDLLQRAISLQSDDLLLNEESRELFNPMVHDEQCDRIFTLLSHGRISSSNSSSEMSDASFASVARAMSAADVEISWMGQPLLLPSSRILRCCLGLLVAWRERIPLDKAKRLQCFMNVVKALVKNLNDRAGSINDEASFINDKAGGAPPDRDLFSEAFASSTVPVNGGHPGTRRDIFRNESAAYFTMFTYLSFGTCRRGGHSPIPSRDSNTLCKQVWSLLADDGMKNRQEWAALNDGSRPNLLTYHGDSFRPYVAAKAISFLTLSVLGLNAWSCDPFVESSSSTDTHGSNLVTNGGSSNLPFLFSCLVACLDCACDAPYKPDIMSCIANCIGIVLIAVGWQAPSRDATQGQQHRYETCSVTEAVVHMLLNTNVLQRSVHSVISASFCDVEDDLCFQVLVAVFRRALMLCPSTECVVAQQTQVVAEPHDDTEDFFGDIDDALLASIDLSGIGFSTSRARNLDDCLSSIYNVWADALKQSKPSSRNSVFQRDADPEKRTMSVQGMKLVSRRSDILCCLLADVAASRWHHLSPMKKLWVIETRFSLYNDQGDARYFKTLSQIFTRHLCSRHHLRNVVEVVRHDKEAFVFNLLEAVLETKLLRKVPSCNLGRIESISGSIGEEKGFTELFSFGKGLPTALCDGLMDLRTFCGDLGRILSSVDKEEAVAIDASAGELLIGFNRDAIDRRKTKLVASLERECFDRFTLLRDCITVSQHQAGSWLSFERVSSLLLASCSTELARLLQKIGLQDQARQGVQQDGYDRAKLFETVACYSELYVCLMSVIFRALSTCGPLSEQFVALLLHITDRFISPLLSGQYVQLLGVLHEIIAFSATFLAGDKPVVGRKETSISSSFDLKPYCDVLRYSLLRRSREFLLSVATGFAAIPCYNPLGMLSAFLAVATNGNESTTASIGCSFSTRAHATTAITSWEDQAHMQSPLTSAIDAEFARLEDCEPLSVDQVKSLVALKRFALQQILVPKLTNNRSDPSSRIGVLRLVQSLLDLEQEEKILVDTARFHALVLCSLAKEIGVSVRAALITSSAVNEELITASFACARSLINLPAACVDSAAVGWLVDWACSSLVASVADDELVPVPSSVLHARYLWYFCNWLKGLGDVIFDGSCTDRIHTLRDQLRCNELMATEKVAWPPIGTGPDQALVSDRLVKLDKRVFPVALLTASGVTITNVYTARSKKVASAESEKGSLEKWIPSLGVRSAVGQFTAKVKYASPVGQS